MTGQLQIERGPSDGEYSSYAVIWECGSISSHLKSNHSFLHTTAQPHNTKASDVMIGSVVVYSEKRKKTVQGLHELVQNSMLDLTSPFNFIKRFNYACILAEIISLFTVKLNLNLTLACESLEKFHETLASSTQTIAHM